MPWPGLARIERKTGGSCRLGNSSFAGGAGRPLFSFHHFQSWVYNVVSHSFENRRLGCTTSVGSHPGLLTQQNVPSPD